MKYVLILISFSVLACAPGKDQPICQISSSTSQVYVHAFGDSITAGAGPSDLCSGYIPTIAKTLGINTDNHAASGSTLVGYQHNTMMNFNLMPDTTPISYFRFDTHSNDFNIVLPGFNDISKYGTDPSHLAQFTSELYEGLMHIAPMNRMTLVGTPLSATQEMQNLMIPLHTDEATNLYDQAVKDVVAQVQAKGLPVYLVDTNAVYVPETMSSENFHPNEYGHQILAQAFLAEFQNH